MTEDSSNSQRDFSPLGQFLRQSSPFPVHSWYPAPDSTILNHNPALFPPVLYKPSRARGFPAPPDQVPSPEGDPQVAHREATLVRFVCVGGMGGGGGKRGKAGGMEATLVLAKILVTSTGGHGTRQSAQSPSGDSKLDPWSGPLPKELLFVLHHPQEKGR